MYCHTQKQSSLISLESFSSNSLSFLVVQVAFETKRRFFSNAQNTRSPTIFSFASYHQHHQHKEEIYNNAAFPRAIP